LISDDLLRLWCPQALNASHVVPDFAITLSTQTTEDKVLDYVWPEFVWVNVTDAFTRYDKAKRFEDSIKWGEDCHLDVGYDSKSDTAAKWPVFCLENSPDKLQGRFGDPVYRYLQVCCVELCHRGASMLGFDLRMYCISLRVGAEGLSIHQLHSVMSGAPLPLQLDGLGRNFEEQPSPRFCFGEEVERQVREPGGYRQVCCRPRSQRVVSFRGRGFQRQEGRPLEASSRMQVSVRLVPPHLVF
jgi:hypothetical protein